MNVDPRLRDCVRRLSDTGGRGRPAFVFATSGLPEPPFRRYTHTFEHLLKAKGFHIAGTFTCRGLDTWGPFKLMGGVSKNRPNDTDFAAAREFATNIALNFNDQSRG